MVVASMIGTGVFTSLGFQLMDIEAGFPILMLWVLGGVLSLCGALCYAELGCMMPRSGGEYHLLAQTYHPIFGFLAGWISVTAGFAAPIASSALVFSSFLQGMWPGFDPKTTALTLILVVYLIQLCQLQWVERFQLSFSLLKVILIFAFVIGAWFLHQADWAKIQPHSTDASYYHQKSYAIALVWVMYAYLGWNGAIYFAGEIQNPQRNLPRALWYGTLCVILLYIALNSAFLISAPWEEMKGQERVALIAAKHIFGQQGSVAMGSLICLGLVAHVSAMTFAGSRVLRTMGEDTRALGSMQKLNRFGAPWMAVSFLMTLVLLLLFTGTFEQLLLYIQGLLLSCSLFAVLGVFWLRYKLPNAPRPFKVPLYPLPPLLFTAVTLWMLISLVQRHPTECAWGLTTLVIGVILYFILKPKIHWDRS